MKTIPSIYICIFLFVVGIPSIIFSGFGLSKLLNDSRVIGEENFDFCRSKAFNSAYVVTSLLSLIPFVNVLVSPVINFVITNRNIGDNFLNNPLNYKLLTPNECHSIILKTCQDNIYLNCTVQLKNNNCLEYGDLACESLYRLNYAESFKFYVDFYKTFFIGMFYSWIAVIVCCITVSCYIVAVKHRAIIDDYDRL